MGVGVKLTETLWWMIIYVFFISLDNTTISFTKKSQADTISTNIIGKWVKNWLSLGWKAERGLVVTYKKLLFNIAKCCLEFLMEKVNILTTNYIILLFFSLKPNFPNFIMQYMVL